MDAETAEAAEITTIEETAADRVVVVVVVEADRVKVGAPATVQTHQIVVVTVTTDMGRNLGTVPPLLHVLG